MWENVLIVNSVLWALSALYLVYSLGLSVITWSFKGFLVALAVFVFLSLTEVALGAINM